MENLITFMNAFLEYFICFAVFVVVIGLGVTIGIVWRKSKNKKLAEEEALRAATAESVKQ